MKHFYWLSALVFVCCMICSYSYGQRKIYKENSKLKVKGTYAELSFEKKAHSRDTVFSSALLAAAIPAVVGSVINAGVGIGRTSSERKQELATATYNTNSIYYNTITKDNIDGELVLRSYYYLRSNGARSKDFQEMVFDIKKSDKQVLIELVRFENDYTRALIRNGKNMLRYQITLNARFTVKEKKDGKDKISEQSYSRILQLVLPDATKEYLDFKKIKSTIPIPNDASALDFSVSISEVNPFFLTNNGIAAYLENYGEDLSAIFTNLLSDSE